MKKIKHYLPDLWSVTKKTGKAWMAADPFRQSAVVSYYAIFSIPALLVIIITVAGFVFGRNAIQGQISGQISSVMGADTAKEVQDMIAKSATQRNSVIATIISVITLLLGSTGVFEELQTSLDQIWGVKVTAKKKWLKSIKNKLFSFGLILSIGFLMLVSLILTTGLEALSGWIKNHFPDAILFLFILLNFALTFGVLSALFALIFKILPDAIVQWRDVWIGAMVTTLLFILGKFALGIYFAKAHPGSTYGAAGSIVLIMLWVSYSCMILFFGAEFTKQFAVFYGREAKPKAEAEMISEEEYQKKK